MSNISNVHQFYSYESTGANKSKALSGQRMCVVRFRKTKENPAPKSSVFASVPALSAADWAQEIERLTPYINQMLCDVQDQIAREAYEAGASHVTTEQLAVGACVSYLVQQAAGDRLTGDAIKEWFVSEMQDILMVAFAEKMGLSDQPTDEESKRLEQILNVYRDKLAALAGGRTMFDPTTRTKLLRALELVDCTDGIGSKLLAKLNAMQNVNIEEMLGL